MTSARKPRRPRALAKCPSGIKGLDQITHGGLPRGRPTLVCGGPGAGKTLLGLEFIVRGATEHDEPGVIIAFEERAADLAANCASLGFDLDRLVAERKLVIDEILISRADILETGEYDLEGLFIRLGSAIDQVGAKRVLLDTLDSLFATLEDTGLLRAELRRLFGWLKGRGVTTVVTGEKGEGGALTRNSLEEYISDCVIVLDQRVSDQVATRRLRVVKYRGSLHGTNEYPFLIQSTGLVVLPITEISLDYPALVGRVPTGIRKLDEMFAGRGVFRGATVMVSGVVGSGKTTIAARFLEAACARGESCIFFAFEQSPAQIVRNMRSVGIRLDKWVKAGRLVFQAARPATFGLETHISLMVAALDAHRPHAVAIDPISAFEPSLGQPDARDMVMRLVDVLKSRGITALFTGIAQAGDGETTGFGLSSLIDTWVLVRNLEQGGERTRSIEVLKSRGQKHSNQVREFLITDRGLDLQDIYMGPEGLLVGSARAAQAVRDRAAGAALEASIAEERAALRRKRRSLQAREAELEAEFAEESRAMHRRIEEQRVALSASASGRAKIAEGRGLRTEPAAPRRDGRTS